MKSSRGRLVALTGAALVVLAACDDPNPAAVPDPASLADVTVGPTADRTVERSTFVGLYFPAGMAGTDTACPYAWQPPSFCVMEPGTQTALPSGRLRIRDMKLYELALAWSEDGEIEPRKTGYDVVRANANLDASLSGPTWGTWELHAFDGTLMFTGSFTGAFVEGVPAVRFSGTGVGTYEGQRMRGNVARTLDADGHNMYGVILERPGR